MMAIMLAAGQLALAFLVVASGLGLGATAALAANALLVMVTMLGSRRRPVGRRWLLLGWLASAVLAALLLAGLGEATPLPTVSSNQWGGLLLTILLSVVGIALSFPFGVALAVGRRSKLPVVRLLSTAYIELVRAVPLITILFMAALLLPLFLPEGVRIENVLRAMGGIIVFSAAYVAENVRGGLQAIPAGQVEAAQAIGLRSWQCNLYHRPAAGVAHHDPGQRGSLHQPAQGHHAGLHRSVSSSSSASAAPCWRSRSGWVPRSRSMSSWRPSSSCSATRCHRPAIVSRRSWGSANDE